ncbi:MAG: hypothetical protein AAF402_09680 [Pseudomonadota bacterium]
MNRRFLGCIFGCGLALSASTGLAIDPDELYPIEILPAIGAEKSEVDTFFGEIGDCQSVDSGLRCDYRKYTTEVTFIEGRADLWKFEGFKDIPMDVQLLRQIGLRPSPPFKRDAYSMHWTGIHGLFVVSAFGGKNLSGIAISRNPPPR